MSAAERDQEGETGKISYVMRSSELPQILHQDKRDAAGVGKVVGRLTQDSKVREREEETQRDVGERGGGEEAGLGRDLERDPEEDGWGLFRSRKAAFDPSAPEEGKSVVAGTCNNEARMETGARSKKPRKTSGQGSKPRVPRQAWRPPPSLANLLGKPARQELWHPFYRCRN